MSIRVAAVAAGIFGLALVLAPLQLIFIKLGARRAAAALPVFYHRLAVKMIGVKVVVVGAPVDPGPVLFVSNHVSWLDIPVIGSTLKTSFVAKREVGDWGAFGTLARLQQTVFIDRERRAQTRDQGTQISRRLDAGDNLVLFAEGTSTDGSVVLPFKSALFVVAERDGVPLTVQPMTVAYRMINGLPITRAMRPVIGWYGDMDLVPHFKKLLSLGTITVELRFHEPVQSVAFPSRKALANHCHEAVRSGLLAARRSSV